MPERSMLNLVTSMNEKLYHEYGDRMISGFEHFAADDVRLIVVFEGKKPEALTLRTPLLCRRRFQAKDHQIS